MFCMCFISPHSVNPFYFWWGKGGGRLGRFPTIYFLSGLLWCVFVYCQMDSLKFLFHAIGTSLYMLICYCVLFFLFLSPSWGYLKPRFLAFLFQLRIILCLLLSFIVSLFQWLPFWWLVCALWTNYTFWFFLRFWAVDGCYSGLKRKKKKEWHCGKILLL